MGQGPFRQALIDRWRGCSVTECYEERFLIASHIKPWSQCLTRAERLGASNGLLPVPNLDKLFDRGFISFDDGFKVRVSSALKDGVTQSLGAHRNLRLKSKADKDLWPFLAWHRDNIFVTSK